jgi:anti-anti-sigma factor
MTLTGLPQSTRPNLVVSVSVEGGGAVMALRGEADPATLPVLMNMLARVIADHEGAVVIDLAEIEFIDTATVRALGRAEQFLGDRGRQLKVRSPTRLAVHVLAFGGLSHLVESARAPEH